MSKPFVGPRLMKTHEQLSGKQDPGPTWRKSKPRGAAMLSPEKRQAIARKGGNATLQKYGADYFRSLGKKGGRALADKYGSDYMAMLGTNGQFKKQESV